MTKIPFQTQLRKALQEDDSLNFTSSKSLKGRVLKSIAQSANKRREEACLSALGTLYKKPHRNVALRIRNHVLAEVNALQALQSTPFYSFFLLFKRSFALGLSFALLAVTVLAPLQYADYQIVPLVQAAYLECEGDVYINEAVCQSNTITELALGDRITTNERSKATIFYTDYSLVRIEEKTTAKIDRNSQEQINIEEGELWVHAPAESVYTPLKITTPEVRAKIPQGSAGVSSKRNMTDVIAETAVVEVQVSNSKGKTEVLTVSPDQNVYRIRKGYDSTNVRHVRLTQRQKQWIDDNKQQDQAHLLQVKQNVLQQSEVAAGTLPGGVPDYVSKLTQKARSALTWDESLKADLQLSQLEEVFSEALVLFDKGDQTTAKATFEAYQQKMVSLFQKEFDKVSVKENDAFKNRALELLDEHVRILSPYGDQDPQYVMKTGLRALTLELDIPDTQPLGKKLQQKLVQSKIAEAHQFVSNGEVDKAQKVLDETSDSLGEDVVSDSSLMLLNQISQQSKSLSPIVQEIKKQTVEKKMKQSTESLVTYFETDIAKGTAVKDEGLESEEQDILSSKIVGQAVKE